MDADSPLSVSSNIIGILTFLVAVSAAAYARVRYLRSAHTEYLRVKKSLLWFKTESEWLGRLLQPLAQGQGLGQGPGKGLRENTGIPHGIEAHMFGFVIEDLAVLEQRLLDLVGRIDSSSGSLAATVSEEGEGSAAASWLALARSLVRGPSVTMAWLSSRTEMLELVRQREALAGRVQFLQLSILSARLAALEARLAWQPSETDEDGSRSLTAYDQR